MTKHLAVYTPVEPSLPAGAVREWVAELVAAGADAVILQGTGDRPDVAPLIAALAG